MLKSHLDHAGETQRHQSDLGEALEGLLQLRGRSALLCA